MIQTTRGSAILFQRGSAILSERAVVLVALIGAHVLLAIFLANGLGSVVVNILRTPIEATFVDAPDDPVPPPQPLNPELVVPVVDLGPVPDVVDETGGDTGTALTPPIVSTGGGEATPFVPPQPEPVRLIGKNQLPNTEDYYPADLRRRGIGGAANVRVCVDERGNIQGQPSVEKSSGNARLDEGAVNVARDGHYARAMRGSAYVANCYGFRVIFQMR